MNIGCTQNTDAAALSHHCQPEEVFTVQTPTRPHTHTHNTQQRQKTFYNIIRIPFGTTEMRCMNVRDSQNTINKFDSSVEASRQTAHSTHSPQYTRIQRPMEVYKSSNNSFCTIECCRRNRIDFFLSFPFSPKLIMRAAVVVMVVCLWNRINGFRIYPCTNSSRMRISFFTPSFFRESFRHK